MFANSPFCKTLNPDCNKNNDNSFTKLKRYQFSNMLSNNKYSTYDAQSKEFIIKVNSLAKNPVAIALSRFTFDSTFKLISPSSDRDNIFSTNAHTPFDSQEEFITSVTANAINDYTITHDITTNLLTITNTISPFTFTESTPEQVRLYDALGISPDDRNTEHAANTSITAVTPPNIKPSTSIFISIDTVQQNSQQLLNGNTKPSQSSTFTVPDNTINNTTTYEPYQPQEIELNHSTTSLTTFRFSFYDEYNCKLMLPEHNLYNHWSINLHVLQKFF